MSGFKLARIGLLLAENDSFAPYYQEVLTASGIQYAVVERSIFNSLNTLDILVLAGYGKLDPVHAEAVADWVRGGGVVVASGSSWGQPGIFGLRADNSVPHPSTAHLRPPESDNEIWPERASDALFFGGECLRTMNAECVCKTSLGTVGVSRRSSEKGHAYFVSFHLGQTMSHMQLGTAVECDRIAPASNEYRFDDGHLRSEDGSILDLVSDRSKVDDSAASTFLQPHCDVLREVLLRTIVKAAHDHELRIICFWHWQNNATGTVMLTVESEEFSAENVQILQRMLQLIGAPATWLIATPGYPMDVYRQMHSWEHDVGLLFHVEEGQSWHDEKLKIQHVTLSRAATMMNVVSARPAGGQWRRLTEFYDIAEGTGVKISLSKGGRQLGTSGFLFGTSRPFYPCRRDGTFYQTMELPYAAFLPGLVTPSEVIPALAEQAALRHGCFQIAVNSVFIPHAAASDGVRRAVSIAKQTGLEFVTASTIVEFDRTRRNLRLKFKESQEGMNLSITPDAEIRGLTLLVSGTDWDATCDRRPASMQATKRYGALFGALVLNLEGKHQSEIVVTYENTSAVAA